MMSTVQSTFIGVGMVALSLAFLLLLNRLWPGEQRRPHNDVVGWQVAVVGTTYAVIVGFMLYAVWTDFEAARNNADAESVALINLYHLSTGLPQDVGASIRADARAYADIMVDREWSTMIHGGDSFNESQQIVNKMWATLASSADLNRSQQVIVDHSITQLSDLTQRRRIRHMESNESLPDILWAILITGAAITIASSCLFGTASFPLHVIQVLALTTLLALSLLAVAEIDRPFQGFVHVPANGFLRAKESFNSPSFWLVSP
jgi:hypothetical protein